MNFQTRLPWPGCLVVVHPDLSNFPQTRRVLVLVHFAPLSSFHLHSIAIHSSSCIPLNPAHRPFPMSGRTVLDSPDHRTHTQLVSTPPRGHTAPTSAFHPIPKIGFSHATHTHPVVLAVDRAHAHSLPTPPASSASSPVAILEAHAHAHAEDPWREKLLFEGENYVEEEYHSQSRVHLEYAESSRIVQSRSHGGMDLGTSSIEGSWRMEGSGHGHGHGHGFGSGSGSGSGISFDSSGVGGVRRGKAFGVESDITGTPEGVGLGTASGAGSGFGGISGGSVGSGGSGLGWAVPSTYAPASTGADPLLGSNTPEGDIRRLTPKDKGKERRREDGVMAVRVLADVMDTSKGRDKVLVSARGGFRFYSHFSHTLSCAIAEPCVLWVVGCGLGNGRWPVAGGQWTMRIATPIANDWPNILPARHVLDRIASTSRAQLALYALRTSHFALRGVLGTRTPNLLLLLLCSAGSCSRSRRRSVPISVPALTPSFFRSQKCAQYSIRTYLYLLSLLAAVRPLSPWFKANAKRMRIAQSGLSLTR